MLGEGLIRENYTLEVEPYEVDLASIKPQVGLNQSIWQDKKLDSRIRLRLLDIADDFRKFMKLSWVKPKDIILTGSICNRNWSNESDIDLHIIIDFKEIGERLEFVEEYVNAKKNQWNNEHDNLTIFGFKVELYVSNITDSLTDDAAVYSLMKDEWINEPDLESSDYKVLNKKSFQDKTKEKASVIMTLIDDLIDQYETTLDSYQLKELYKTVKKVLELVKEMRKDSLSHDGEYGMGNIIYKLLRRENYLQDLWDLQTSIYDDLMSLK